MIMICRYKAVVSLLRLWNIFTVNCHACSDVNKLTLTVQEQSIAAAYICHISSTILHISPQYQLKKSSYNIARVHDEVIGPIFIFNGSYQ